MHLLTYSTVFWPSVGGMENRLRLLATEFVRQGHETVLVTETAATKADQFPFRVVRRPSLKKFLKLLAWSDLMHQNNVTLKCLHPLAFVHRPLVISHHSEYVRRSGRRGVRDITKLGVAHLMCNIACSQYIANQFRRCEVILNPYDSSTFFDRRWQRDRELMFVGRLVSEKGCDTLIEALAQLGDTGLRPMLTIVGDGPDRHRLQALAGDRRLSRQIEFAGPMEPNGIAEMLNRHRILVVPSRYREPFGIVALEGLACGCFPVVSQQGGLVEAVGKHGATFTNGCAKDLAGVLTETLCGWPAALAKLEGVDGHLAERTPGKVAAGYLAVFQRALSGRG